LRINKRVFREGKGYYRIHIMHLKFTKRVSMCVFYELTDFLMYSKSIGVEVFPPLFL